jgi:hypothetical protein
MNTRKENTFKKTGLRPYRFFLLITLLYCLFALPVQVHALYYVIGASPFVIVLISFLLYVMFVYITITATKQK